MRDCLARCSTIKQNKSAERLSIKRPTSSMKTFRRIQRLHRGEVDLTLFAHQYHQKRRWCCTLKANPALGTIPGEHLWLRELVLAVLAPNLTWHSSKMTVLDRMQIGCLAPYRVTKQPGRRASHLRNALDPASRSCYSTQAYGGTAPVPWNCLDVATQENCAKRI